MGNNIFDWDDEEEKKEEPQRDYPQTVEFQQPVQAVDYWEQDERDNSAWQDPWKEPAGETPWRQEEAQWEQEQERAGETPWQQQDAEWEQEEVEYVPYRPESADETARRGGLAWSAGIVFFSAIVFMLFIGWGADRLLGSSPWGIVGGIVLGSIIGFIQFFRISSQIFNSSKNDSSIRPLMPRDDDDYKR